MVKESDRSPQISWGERSFPVMKVKVIKVIKDFGFSKYPSII